MSFPCLILDLMKTAQPVLSPHQGKQVLWKPQIVYCSSCGHHFGDWEAFFSVFIFLVEIVCFGGSCSWGWDEISYWVFLLLELCQTLCHQGGDTSSTSPLSVITLPLDIMPGNIVWGWGPS